MVDNNEKSDAPRKRKSIFGGRRARSSDTPDVIATPVVAPETQPERATQLFTVVLADAKAAPIEGQRALAALAKLRTPGATQLLDLWAAKLALNEVPRELQVDAVEALKAAPSPARDKLRGAYEGAVPKDPVGKFQSSLTGGDAGRGREIFVNHAAAQCVRCHVVNGEGGKAGPDLTGVATRYPAKTRDHLLESIVLPSAKIAVGFATVTLTLADGRVVAGTVLAEDKVTVTVQTPDGQKLTVPLADIDARTAPVSAMPSAERALTPREMRDLIEYLSTLK